jgi:hypothetical protein
MAKLFLAIVAATATAVVSTHAAPRNDAEAAKMVATSPGGTLKVGNQCWKPTDSGRGYGYWTGCENVYSFTLGRRGLIEVEAREIENGGGTEGGGGGDGGSGGGGGDR